MNFLEIWRISIPLVPRNRFLFYASIVFTTILPTEQTVLAHDYKSGSLEIAHPWARATPPGAKTGAGYLKITNRAVEEDRLIAATSPVAEKVEFHEGEIVDGIARMRPLLNGVVISGGQKFEFTPSKTHVMFVGLKGPLRKGEKVPAVLTFERAGAISLEFVIDAVGTPSSPELHGEH